MANTGRVEWASGGMADARGLGPRGETLAGSSPVSPTKTNKKGGPIPEPPGASNSQERNSPILISAAAEDTLEHSARRSPANWDAIGTCSNLWRSSHFPDWAAGKDGGRQRSFSPMFGGRRPARGGAQFEWLFQPATLPVKEIGSASMPDSGENKLKASSLCCPSTIPGKPTPRFS